MLSSYSVTAGFRWLRRFELRVGEGDKECFLDKVGELMGSVLLTTRAKKWRGL